MTYSLPPYTHKYTIVQTHMYMYNISWTCTLHTNTITHVNTCTQYTPALDKGITMHVGITHIRVFSYSPQTVFSTG